MYICMLSIAIIFCLFHTGSSPGWHSAQKRARVLAPACSPDIYAKVQNEPRVLQHSQ